jgi:ABC-type transport system involved in multi-copper enzyme maturation permease subunit
MLRLVLKDILVGVIGNWWLIFLWLFFASVEKILPITAGVISMILISASIGYDESAKIDTLYSSLPIKRSTYVLAKYLSTYSILVGVLLLTFLLQLILTLFSFTGSHPVITMRSIFYLFFPLTLLFSFYFPIHFRIGSMVEKKIIFIVIIVLLSLLVTAIGFLVIVSSEIDIFKIRYIYLYLTMIMIFFLVTSIGLSIKLFAKRDLL